MDERRIAMNLREKVMGGVVYPQVAEQKKILAEVIARLERGEDLSDAELEALNAEIGRGQALNDRVRMLVAKGLSR